MDKGSPQDHSRLEVLNPRQLASIKKLQAFPGQEDLLSELVESFIKDAQSAIERLRAAIEAGDLEGVEQAAHKLKGASGSLGADRLMAALGELEDSASEGGPLPTGILLRIEATFKDARLALLEEVSGAS